MFADKLRKSLLQAAIQGQLTEQLPTDGNARDLLKKIRDEKAKLIKAKKIKAEKPLPPVTDDEIPFELPANWCWCRLVEVCQMNTGNSIAEAEKKSKYMGHTDGLCYIGTKDVSFDNQIDYDNGVRIPLNENFKRAQKNSVLMCIEGGSAGRKIAMTDREVCFGNKLCNFDAANVSNRYIYFYLRSPEFKKFFVDNITGIIGGVSMKRLNSIPLPLPPLAEQLRIVERLDALLSEVTELAKDERELNLYVKNFPRKMKNSLLQAAIQGQLTEQLPTDGDARDLLKKIRDEKAKLIKAKKIKAEKPLPPVTDDEIPFELPANWCWCRLGDIGVFISGYTPKRDELTTDGKIPYFKVADMNTKGNEIWMHKTNLYLKTDSARTYEKNTIVYPKNGGAVLTNKKRILRQDSVVDLNTGGYKVMEPINLMYLFNFFLTINFKLLYKGTALPTLDNKRLQKLLFPLPPLAEQLRIVERLNELLPLCEI